MLVTRAAAHLSRRAQAWLTFDFRQSMKLQTPAVGAIFTIPLVDGSRAIGQIVGREPQVLNSWTCAFSRLRLGKEEVAEPKDALLPEDVISVQFVTGDLLKKGRWKIHAHAPVRLPKSDFPHEECRANGWIGAKIIGSGIIESFLAAFYGLGYWDEMKDPEYYDHLLLLRISRPDEIKRKTA